MHDKLTLNDGNTIPVLGFGLWRITDEQAEKTVADAAQTGYRLFDTAAYYHNETGVGAGIRASGVRREDLFITTKLWNDRHGYRETLAAFDESMNRLGLDYLDLYLIHWPVAGSEKYLDSWQAFMELKAAGRVKSIGVSNFLPKHLDRIQEVYQTAPAVNQIECHPYFQQPDVDAANRRHCVVTQAWAPLGRGRAFAEPAIAALADKYKKTPAQIVLRWHLDSHRIVIPKTAHPDRMRENFNVRDFTLTPGEQAQISAIATIDRIGTDPDTTT